MSSYDQTLRYRRRVPELHNISQRIGGSQMFLAPLGSRNAVNAAIGNTVYNTVGPYSTAPVDAMIDNLIASSHPMQLVNCGRDKLHIRRQHLHHAPPHPVALSLLYRGAKNADASSIPVPSTFSLPAPRANYRRKYSRSVRTPVMMPQRFSATLIRRACKALQQSCGSFSEGTISSDERDIPNNIPMQLVGDASNCGTFITWSGSAPGLSFASADRVASRSNV